MILDEILVTADVRAAAAEAQLSTFKETAASARPARAFEDALRRPGLSIIAEIKRRSPSAGAIAADLDPVAQATAYERGGADAISVLTEPHFFDGSLEDLRRVREAVSLPVLRKDFTRNAAQVWEARAAGADAILLIVAALDDGALRQLLREASDAGVAALVEAHTTDEVARAVDAGASIIGVNNRDLRTFVTDLAVAERAASSLPEITVTVAESGVSSPEGARRMAAAGFDAILVGEALVRHDDPAQLVALLKGAS